MHSSPISSPEPVHTLRWPSRVGEIDGKAADREPTGDEALADDGTDFWFCASPDGSLKTVERGELINSLKQGSMTSKSLVWRQGWADWLAAGQVAELSAALPAFARGPIMSPKADPDRTHPPPVPASVKSARSPIIPVSSNPNNDKPKTQLLVETELTGSDLEAVQPPPPSKRSDAPPAPSRRGTPFPPRVVPVAKAPIVPVASSPDNDKPNTEVIAASEIVIEEDNAPPKAHWVEVSSPAKVSATEPTITEQARPAKLDPIVPVDSNPNHEPVTGTLDDDEIQIVEAAAGAQVQAKTSPEKPPASIPSLDGLAAMVEAKKPTQPARMIAVSKPKLAPAAAAPAPVPHAPVPHAPVPHAPVPHAPVLHAPPAPVIIPGVEPVSEGPTQLANAIVPVSDPDNEAPTQIHPAALLPDAAPLPSFEVEADPAALPAPPQPAAWQAPAAPAYGPPPAQAYPSYAPPKKKSALPLIIGVVGVLGVLGAAAVGGLLFFKPWEKALEAQPSAKPVVSASAAPVVQLPPIKCSISKDATRLSPSVQVSVPPYVAPAGGSKIAIGFAATDVAGLGLMVDLATLETEQAFSAPSGRKLIGVVPVPSEKDRFVADREGGALKVPHTIDQDPNFTVGFSGSGYARLPRGGTPDELWANVENEKATEARVGSVKGLGHALTFRTAGKVRVGWLGPKGLKKSELGVIETEGRAGTPTIAAGDKGILVTFAAKAGDDGPWVVKLASAKHGELPKSAQTFEMPSGGPGGDAIAPVAEGLPGGRWLLQWTEGSSGERAVRVQVLGEDLAPMGEALRVSAAGKEAGQGVLAVAGEKAASFQLVKADKGYELWATALSCK